MRLLALCMILLTIASSCGHNHTSDNKSSDIKNTHTHKVKPPLDLWAVDSVAYRRWGSPASPYRDEERYVRFLDSLLVIDSLPETLRERAEYRRRIAMMNRPGTVAADFRYLERHGKVAHLHNLKSPMTLLLFYDPECPHCNDILRSLASSKAINAAIAEKQLTVIAIYAEGKRDVWDKTRNDMPQNWLVGYDLTGILDKEIYDLPAMPTPYLLDGEKRVVLKDPQIRTLIGIISQM